MANGEKVTTSFDIYDKGTPAYERKAIRRQVAIYFSKDKKHWWRQLRLLFSH